MVGGTVLVVVVAEVVGVAGIVVVDVAATVIVVGGLVASPVRSWLGDGAVAADAHQTERIPARARTTPTTRGLEKRVDTGLSDYGRRPTIDVNCDSAEEASGQRIWLRNSFVRSSCGLWKKCSGVPTSTI